MTKEPEWIDHPYKGHRLEAAFEAFVLFASKASFMVDWFLDDHPECKPSPTPIDRMIDENTGKNKEIADTFVLWCVEVFGPPDAIE